jgi:penicillin-binding protein 1A
MARRRRFLLVLLTATVALGLFALGGLVAGYLYLSSQLPSVEALRDVRYQQPLRVFAEDERLIGEFGEYRRMPLPYHEVPSLMKAAFLAAEDERFFSHPGVDWQGLARAVLHLARHREIGPGGSTITMQTARNFFLTREQTYIRKVNEILLSFKIERELSKDQILELYLNKIYLGQRAYGVGAASLTYFGKHPNDLTVAETAMIAGLPKAPSLINPIRSPERALQRRGYVLRRMLETGAIDEPTFLEALAAPISTVTRRPQAMVDAPYVAEMARAQAVALLGETDAYTGGYRVYTTLDTRMQAAAGEAVVSHLIDYDRRQGYRGPLARHAALPADDDGRLGLLAAHRRVAGLRAALVTRVDDQIGMARLLLDDGGQVDLRLVDVGWARPVLPGGGLGPAPTRVGAVVAVGDVIRVRQMAEGIWALAQIPEVQGAFVALSPLDGRIVALVGGFDFAEGQFNRATQALRQPGSAFKPFIFSAALERGFTTASIVNDAPVVFDDPALETAWRPENYTGRFYGPTRLREALAQSRNLVAIRLLREIGVNDTVAFLERFGWSSARMPRDLSLALGTGEVTPLELAAGYAVFANGGYRVDPWLVARIENDRGETVFRWAPDRVCDPCEAGQPDMTAIPAARVLPADNAFLVDSMLQEVMRTGTGRRSQTLQRRDLAGKTGTTNELNDAWFAGYNAELVAAVWVGFDQPRSLGSGETGSQIALPIWIDFMASALRGRPEATLPRPPGLITARIDPRSGLLTSADNPEAVFETFRESQLPDREPAGRAATSPGGATSTGSSVERSLF